MLDLDPAGTQPLRPARGLGVRIARAEDDARDACRDDRVGARRRRAVVRARLERHVHRRAPRAPRPPRRARRSRRGGPPASVAPSPTIVAVAHEHGADRRLRIRPVLRAARASSIARSRLTRAPGQAPVRARRGRRRAEDRRRRRRATSRRTSWSRSMFSCADAAVDLDAHIVLGSASAQPAHAVVRRAPWNVWPRVAGMDRHAEHEVGLAAHGRDVLAARSPD